MLAKTATKKSRYSRAHNNIVIEPLKNGTIETWLFNAEPGDKYCYFHGFGLPHGVGNYMYKLALQGKVYLFQKRVADNNFQYLAIKASYPPARLLVPAAK